MAYTPHTWTTNETITAAKLNNLEEGVSSAGGGNPLITFNFSGFGSYSFYLNFGIGEYDGANDEYVALPLIGIPGISGAPTLYTCSTYNPDGKLIFPCPLPIPKDDYLALVFLAPSNGFTTTVSGNISQSTIDFAYGSTNPGYIITGDCTINITPTTQ